MDLEKSHTDVNNTKSFNQFKMAKTLDTTGSALCALTTTTATGPTEGVDGLTSCTRCNSKGVNFYLGASNSHKAKLLKALIILLATICTAYVCMLSSCRYFNTWVQTVIERTDVHVSEIPFPAITICPVRGINWMRLEKQAMADQDLQKLRWLLQSLNDVTWLALDDVFENTKHDNQSVNVEEFLEKLSSKGETHALDAINLNDLSYFQSFECEDLFGECAWRRERVSCCSIFRKIHTYKGICYAFNSLQVEDPITSWPWFVSDSGLHTGLRVRIKRSSIGSYYERVATMVHDPADMDTSYVNYLSGERVVITVNPLRFTADYDIHSISPDIRHCYFTNEFKLLYTSRSNCMRNCRILYIERNCNCTYLYPMAINSNTSLPICKASNLICIYKLRGTLLSMGNIFEETIDDVQFNTFNCKCYRNCNFIQYGTMVNSDNTVETNTNKYIDLKVHYQHETLFSYRSTLCFNLLDLIVSYGGIAGLFLGLSLVGIIELLHDFIVCWQVRTQNNIETHVNGTTKQRL